MSSDRECTHSYKHCATNRGEGNTDSACAIEMTALRKMSEEETVESQNLEILLCTGLKFDHSVIFPPETILNANQIL